MKLMYYCPKCRKYFEYDESENKICEKCNGWLLLVGVNDVTHN